MAQISIITALPLGAPAPALAPGALALAPGGPIPAAPAIEAPSSGAFAFAKPALAAAVTVDADKLSKGITKLLKDLEKVVLAQDKKIGKFRVDEIELNLAVNASGGVSLIGSFEAGIEGGITITLKRQE